MSRIGASADTTSSSGSGSPSPPPELVFVHGGHVDKINDLSWHGAHEGMLASVADNGLLHVWQPSREAIAADGF
jgi:hypothetical protein